MTTEMASQSGIPDDLNPFFMSPSRWHVVEEVGLEVLHNGDGNDVAYVGPDILCLPQRNHEWFVRKVDS